MKDSEIINIWNKCIEQDPDNVDLHYARKIFCQVPKNHIIESFAANIIERTDELRFMPQALFRIYFPVMLDFILYVEHSEEDASMIADCFTSLVEEKLELGHLDSFAELNRVFDSLDYFESNLKVYNTDPDIYGDLSEKLTSIKSKL